MRPYNIHKQLVLFTYVLGDRFQILDRIRRHVAAHKRRLVITSRDFDVFEFYYVCDFGLETFRERVHRNQQRRRIQCEQNRVTFRHVEKIHDCGLRVMQTKLIHFYGKFNFSGN